MNENQKVAYETAYPMLLSRMNEMVHGSFNREERLQESLAWSIIEFAKGGTIAEIVDRSRNRKRSFAKNYEGVGRKPPGVTWIEDIDLTEHTKWDDRYCDEFDMDEFDSGFRLSELPAEFAQLASFEILGLEQDQIAIATDSTVRTVQRRVAALRTMVETIQERNCTRRAPVAKTEDLPSKKTFQKVASVVAPVAELLSRPLSVTEVAAVKNWPEHEVARKAKARLRVLARRF